MAKAASIVEGDVSSLTLIVEGDDSRLTLTLALPRGDDIRLTLTLPLKEKLAGVAAMLEERSRRSSKIVYDANERK